MTTSSFLDRKLIDDIKIGKIENIKTALSSDLSILNQTDEVK